MTATTYRRRRHVAALLITLSAVAAGLSAGPPATAGPPGAPHSAKAQSPSTNLAAYPKLTPRQLAARTTADHDARTHQGPVDTHAVELTTSELLDDGRLRVEYYTLAPGADPDKVADTLRREGRKNVRLERHEAKEPADFTVASSDDCAYGSARATSCPNSWWSNLSRNNPVVLFNDLSSDAWPTTNAVYKWNQTPNIDSWYTYNNCNASNVHCVNVFSASYGQIGWIGKTDLYYFPPSQGRILDATINLNDSYEPTYFTRNSVVTHEMGHALGLGHNEWSGDVMWWAGNSREDIGGENPALLAQIYSIDRQ